MLEVLNDADENMAQNAGAVNTSTTKRGRKPKANYVEESNATIEGWEEELKEADEKEKKSINNKISALRTRIN